MRLPSRQHRAVERALRDLDQPGALSQALHVERGTGTDSAHHPGGSRRDLRSLTDASHRHSVQSAAMHAGTCAGHTHTRRRRPGGRIRERASLPQACT